MIIYRGDKAIELKFSEILDAHNEFKLDCMIEDVRATYEQEFDEIKLSEEEIQEIAIQAQHNLSKNDAYFEAYWESVRCTLKKYISDKEL